VKNCKHFCQRLRIDNEVDNTKPVISYESKVILTNTKYTKEKNAIIAVYYICKIIINKIGKYMELDVAD